MLVWLVLPRPEGKISCSGDFTPPSPFFLDGGVGEAGGEGSYLVPRAAGRALCIRGGPGRSPRETFLGGRREGLGQPAAARSVAFPLHLSRPPSIWPGFPLRAYCARTAPSARRGRSGPRVPRLGSSFPAPLLSVPGTVTPGQYKLCTYELCFRNRLRGLSLAGSRGFPQYYSFPSRDHMLPSLPLQCREPAFCLSAVRR